GPKKKINVSNFNNSTITIDGALREDLNIMDAGFKYINDNRHDQTIIDAIGNSTITIRSGEYVWTSKPLKEYTVQGFVDAINKLNTEEPTKFDVRIYYNHNASDATWTVGGENKTVNPDKFAWVDMGKVSGDTIITQSSDHGFLTISNMPNIADNSISIAAGTSISPGTITQSEADVAAYTSDALGKYSSVNEFVKEINKRAGTVSIEYKTNENTGTGGKFKADGTQADAAFDGSDIFVLTESNNQNFAISQSDNTNGFWTAANITPATNIQPGTTAAKSSVDVSSWVSQTMDNYTVDQLMKEMNDKAGDANITYDPKTDRFTIKDPNNNPIGLSDSAANGFFAAANIPDADNDGDIDSGDILSAPRTSTTDTAGWTSLSLNVYNSIDRFMQTVNAKSGTATLTYEPLDDKFKVAEDNHNPFGLDESDAIPGEFGFWSAANITPGPILQHPQVSESDVVKDTVELTDTFERATFKRRDFDINRYLYIDEGVKTWRSQQLSTYNSIQDFMDAIKSGTNYNVELRYEDDRFVFVNKGPNVVKIRDDDGSNEVKDGFLYAAQFNTEEGSLILAPHIVKPEIEYTPQISQDVAEWTSAALADAAYTSIDKFLEILDAKSGTVTVTYDPNVDRFTVKEDNGNPFGLMEENVNANEVGLWNAMNITPNTKLTHPQVSSSEVVKNTVELTDTFERATFANYKDFNITRRLSINEGVKGINPWVSKPLNTYTSIQAFFDDIANNTNIEVAYRNDRFILTNTGPNDVTLMDVDDAGNAVKDGFLYVSRFSDENPDVVGTQVTMKPKETDASDPQVAYVEGKIESGDVSDIDLSEEGSGYSLNGRINGRMVGKMKGILQCESNVAGPFSADVPFNLTGKIDTKKATSLMESPPGGEENINNLEALVDIKGLTIISGVGNLAIQENCASGEIIGEIQGLAGDANMAMGGIGGDIPIDPVPEKDYAFNLNPYSIDYDILTPATIEGEVTGITAGKIRAYVEGHVWTESGEYKGYLEQQIDGDYMVSGYTRGLIEGVALGNISGKVLGEVYAETQNAETNMPEAIINGRIVGEVNDAEVVVEGHVHSRGEGYTDHIGAYVDVEGEAGAISDPTTDFAFDDMYASLEGTLEGVLYGNCEGNIEGLVKHARIDSQMMEGKGYLKQNPDGKNYALIKWNGTLEGKLNDYGDITLPDPLTGVKAGEVAKEIYSMMDKFENPNPATDPAANSDNQLSIYIDGKVEGNVQLRDSNDRIHGVCEGEIEATDPEVDEFAIEGHIIGEVNTDSTWTDTVKADGAEFVGDYKGTVDNIWGKVDGKIDGTLSSTDKKATFKGEAEGVIEGHIVGYVDGYLEGVGDVEGDLDVHGKLTGKLIGSVESDSLNQAIVQGTMDGFAEGLIDGQVDAKVIDTPGLLRRLRIDAQVEKATSGIIELNEDNRVVNAYRDTDANSPNPAHRANNLLDITDEIPTNDTIWDQVTTDGNAYFEININGNDVAVLLPSGNTRPEEITFAPNTMEEAGDTINADYMVSSTARLNEDRIYEKEIHIFDSLGNDLLSKFQFERLGTNEWLWTLRNPVEKDKLAGYGIARFNSDGTYNKDISYIGQSPSDPMTFDADGGTITGTVTGESRSIGHQGIYIDPPELPYPGDQGGSPPAEYGAEAMRIDLHLEGLTQNAQHDAKITAEQDGYGIGYLQNIHENVKINRQGTIIGEFSNGQRVELGKIALATFINPTGLKREAGTYFLETANSGKPDIGTAGENGKGSIAVGNLEMSNVNITDEFVNMVLSERAYMTSSRVITQADRMLMDLMRMRM
ncbi:MAG: flagellar hook-basal body complex protein, partial [bacterium]|nr:flagellar hook-basal body complex protein [bacterium]